MPFAYEKLDDKTAREISALLHNTVRDSLLGSFCRKYVTKTSCVENGSRSFINFFFCIDMRTYYNE